MADPCQLYVETSSHFEVICSQIEHANDNGDFETLHKILETSRVKLLTLIEKDTRYHNSFRNNALQEAQHMLKVFWENSNQGCHSNASNYGDVNVNMVKDEKPEISPLEQTVLKPGMVTFNDIAGLDEAKTLLKEAIVLPLQYPHLFVGRRKPWRRILLYGPPGTGKSRMAQAISSEIDSKFYSVSSSDLLSSWFGGSEKLIKELFENARLQEGKAIIFIDEIDSLCRKRDSKEAETTRRVKTELLKQLDGANQLDQSDVFFICATNCPWELDTAFLRRFEKRIYLTLPDRQARKTLLEICMGEIQLELGEDELVDFLNQTDGYSGSDIATCVSDALLGPIRELQDTTHWKWSDDKSSLTPSSGTDAPNAVALRMQNIPREKVQPRAVMYNDLIKSLSANHRTICCEDLERYERFTQIYGQMG